MHVAEVECCLVEAILFFVSSRLLDPPRRHDGDGDVTLLLQCLANLEWVDYGGRSFPILPWRAGGCVYPRI